MARWLVTVNSSSTNFDFRTKSRVLAIRSRFAESGFTVINRESLYYNPHSQRIFYVFYVQHPKESAISLFMLKYDLSDSITVEQL